MTISPVSNALRTSAANDDSEIDFNDLIGSLFRKALKEIGTSYDRATAYLKANLEGHQAFVAKCCEEMLLEVNKLTDVAEAKGTIQLYRDMIQASEDISINGAARCMDLAWQIQKNTQDMNRALLTKLLDVKAKYLLFQEERLDIVIQRNKAIQDAELAAAEFQYENARLNDQQKNEILQREYQAFLTAYNQELALAQNLVAKNMPGFQLTMSPPIIQGEKVLPGKVSFIKTLT